MTRGRLVSAFVVWHLTAILLGAIPPPDRVSTPSARERPGALGPVGDRVTDAFDGLASVIQPISRGIWWVTRPLHRAADSYRALTGLGQAWGMFSNPPRVDQYVRTRYYVQPGIDAGVGRRWIASELVMPAHREDRVRLVTSYRDSYQDKAIAIALETFYRRRKPALIRPDTRSDELPNDLAPIGRYFARRFARRELAGTAQRIIRTEVWVGNAASPDLGGSTDRAVHVTRLAALQAYYEGAVEQRLTVPPYPPYHAGEQEADIQWVLEYYEEP
jgi:hypothetical protein